MIYPFMYKAEIVDRDRHSCYKQAGIIHGECFSDAVDNLVKYYGEEDIVEIMSLFPLEDGPVILNGDAFRAIKEGVWDVDTKLEDEM